MGRVYLYMRKEEKEAGKKTTSGVLHARSR
jgi:hypothetical protein